MARPALFPDFALNNLNNPGPNVIEPSIELKNSGWLNGQKPPREYFNWLHRLTNDWLKYLDEQQQDILTNFVASSITNDSALSGTTVKDALDGMQSLKSNIITIDVLQDFFHPNPDDVVINNLVSPCNIYITRITDHYAILDLNIEANVSDNMNFFVIDLPTSVPIPDYSTSNEILRGAFMTKCIAVQMTSGCTASNYVQLEGVYMSMYFDVPLEITRLVFGGPELSIKMPTGLSPLRQTFPSPGAAYCLSIHAQLMYKIFTGA